jgi:hypothetical protein
MRRSMEIIMYGRYLTGRVTSPISDVWEPGGAREEDR